MAPNDPAQELQRWDSYLMETPGRKGQTVMAKKKTESILVPLLPRFDSTSFYDPYPLRTSVGKMTVTRDDAFPGTIRFENFVSFKDEALVESKIFETLLTFLGSSTSAGYVVSVDYDRDHPTPLRKGETRAKDDKGLPRGFDLEQLELPILSCALKTYDVAVGMPAEALCYGKLYRRDQTQFIDQPRRRGASKGRLETEGLNIKIMPDRKVTEVSYEEREIVNHLAGLQRLAVFSPVYAEELLGPADGNVVTVQERVELVLGAGSSPDFIRKMNEAGFISEGVPAQYRDSILRKARELFDTDLEIWDQHVAPMFKEHLGLDMPWVAGDFYGNPRKAELKSEQEPAERVVPVPARALPVFRPE